MTGVVQPPKRPKYKRDYPLENVVKYMGRRRLYESACETPRWANAVTLVGPEAAAELTEMRCELRWPLERAWFVDSSRKPAVIRALRTIKWLHPETNVVHGNLIDVVGDIGPIGFANLDFMGPFGTVNQQCFRTVCRQLAPRGMIGLTSYRGREMRTHFVGRQIAALGNEQSWSDRRWVVLYRSVQTIAEEIGKPLTLRSAFQYQHGHTPMCVSIWEHCP